MILFALAALFPAVLLAAPPPKVYNCYRPDSAKGAAGIPIVIDGQLNDPGWAIAPWTDPFVDIEGDRKPAPRYRTRVKMLWDDEYFYIGAELEEPHVWATIKERDKVIFHDNDFEVFLDPDGDNHQYGELEINAFNTQWDLFLPRPYKDNGHALNEWNIEGLKTAVHVYGTLNNPSDTDQGWSVEIALPWRGLEMCSRDYGQNPPPKSWRVNFSRVEWDTQILDGRYVKVLSRPEHNWVWSPQGVIDMHRPEMWGVVNFLHTVDPKPKLPPDFDWPRREAAHSIYYAQKDFQKDNKRWAASVEELGLAFPDSLQVIIDVAPPGYRARIESVVDSLFVRAGIRDDAYFWYSRRPHVAVQE